MADVTLTAALRSNLLSLQGTQRLLDQTQLRLATGKKVNSALDDANAFFAAQSLSNRAGDLSRILDSLGQGVQVLKAADEGISSLTALVEQAESIAREAKDQASGNALYVDTTVSFTAAEAADIVGQTAIANNDTFTVRLGPAGNPTTTITIETGDTLQDIVSELNNINGLAAQIVDGSTAGEFSVQISSTNGQDITVANGTNTPATVLFGAGGVTTHTASTGVPTDLVQLQNDYNEVRTQIDALITDTGYRGTNLLNGDTLSVDFNEDGSSSISVQGTTLDTTATGLNISAADFDTVADIDTALNEIDAALSKLRSTARSFGTSLNIIQNREDFTRNLINTLNEGADKLTLADTNEEGAKLLSLQTSQQLGITSLALASQAQQSVLRLF